MNVTLRTGGMHSTKRVKGKNKMCLFVGSICERFHARVHPDHVCKRSYIDLDGTLNINLSNLCVSLRGVRIKAEDEFGSVSGCQ